MTSPSVPEPSAESSSSTLSSSDALVPDEYLCPLTLNVMSDPVVSKFGHSYERDAILKWLIEHQSCPMTRQPLKLSDLITNHQLRARIRKWQVEYEQDITVVCTTLDFEERMAGYYFLPDLDDTERSEEDYDEDDEGNAGSGNSQHHRRGGTVVPGGRHSGLRRYHRRLLRQQQRSATSSSVPSSRSGNSSISSLSRRIFGRPASAA